MEEKEAFSPTKINNPQIQELLGSTDNRSMEALTAGEDQRSNNIGRRKKVMSVSNMAEIGLLNHFSSRDSIVTGPNHSSPKSNITENKRRTMAESLAQARARKMLEATEGGSDGLGGSTSILNQHHHSSPLGISVSHDVLNGPALPQPQVTSNAGGTSFTENVGKIQNPSDNHNILGKNNEQEPSLQLLNYNLSENEPQNSNNETLTTMALTQIPGLFQQQNHSNVKAVDSEAKTNTAPQPLENQPNKGLRPVSSFKPPSPLRQMMQSSSQQQQGQNAGIPSTSEDDIVNPPTGSDGNNNSSPNSNSNNGTSSSKVKSMNNRISQSFDLFRKVNNRMSKLQGHNQVTSADTSINEEPSETPISSVQDRKAKRLVSTVSLAMGSIDELRRSTLRPGDSGSPTTPTGGNLTYHPLKSFKEWYPGFVAASKQMHSEIRHDQEFGDLVSLKDIFGVPGSDSVVIMMGAARAYERAYKDPLWSKVVLAPKFNRQGLKKPSISNDDMDEDLEEEVKYRVLNIFQDGPIDYVSYNNQEEDQIVSAHGMDLVDALIFPLNQDMKNAWVFLSSFRTIITPIKLLEALIEWYNVENSSECTMEHEQFLKKNKRAIQSRVVKIVSAWVNHHWSDFVDEQLFQELMSFVHDISEVSFGDSQKLTQCIREQRLSWYTIIYIPPFQQKKTSVSADLSKAICLFWETDEFAFQLTQIDHFHFSLIKVDTLSHLLIGAKKDGGGSDVALKVTLEYVAWFRMISSYTASLIIREDTTKKKLHVLKRWIKTARECRKFNNFNTMFAIIHGLKRSFIVGLTALWEQLPAKYVEVFFELERLTSPQNGYAKFWEEWRAVKTPAIPFIGAYIHDLLDIHLNTPTILTNVNNMINNSGQVNMSKFYDLFSTLSEIDGYRQQGYSEKMVKLDSAIQWGLPQPGAGNANPVLDYPHYILSHLREWALAYMIDDMVLDGNPL